MRNPVEAAKSPSVHFMKNRKLEIALGFAAVIIGCLLLIDAFDSRGKKMMWPLSGLAPW